MAMSPEEKQARATARAELKKLTIPKLKKIAQDVGLIGYSGMNKAELARAIVKKQGGEGAGYARDWHGRVVTEDAYRLLITLNNAIYGDLGPYASARAALVDAKTLLRTRAPTGKYVLSNAEGRDDATAIGGVDGYTVLNSAQFDPSKDEDLEGMGLGAYVVRSTSSDHAFAPDQIGGKKITEFRLNKGRGSRRNKNVSFTTRSGERVSFKTKKNASSPRRISQANANASDAAHSAGQQTAFTYVEKMTTGTGRKPRKPSAPQSFRGAQRKEWQKGFDSFVSHSRNNPRRNSKAIPKTKAAFISEYYKLLDKWAGSRKYLGAGKYTPLTKSAEKAGARLQDMVEAHYGWATQASDRWEADQQLNRNPRRNKAGWIRSVDREMEEHGTVGAFTKQARTAGYDDTMEFAHKVMEGWNSGRKTVYNKRTRRQQKISLKTMRRANFAINAQRR